MQVATEIRHHEVSELFPLMDDADLSLLAADIAANGLREPILLHPDGSILDGRNRYAACQLAGVEPTFRTWNAEGSAVAFVVSLNLRRRHLDTSQRAMVAARIANLPYGANRFTIESEISDSTTQPAAAQMLNVSADSVGFGRRVLEEGAPELVQAVDRGEVAVSSAAVLTTLSPEDQAAVVALPEEERREVIREIREGKTPHVARNSGNNEWYTPELYIKAARQVLGSIDLDPASSAAANKVVRAKQFYSIDDDGLTLAWNGTVWMNPPYAQPLVAQFCEKLTDSIEAKTVSAAVVLVNNATETAWFRELADRAAAVCFPSGRVKFWSPDKESATPLQGQAVLYLGPKRATFVAAFSHIGVVWVKP